MTYQTLIVEKQDSVLSIILNRPQVKNAFNDELISELSQVFTGEALDASVRIVVLRGAGDLFCAGGDLNWMKQSASYTPDQNKKDALIFAQMLTKANTLPKPLITLVHGAAFGGGIGLVSVSDYVIASSEALFSFSEVKLGLIPAVIGPFVISKIGESMVRALFISAERFPAARAFGIGLVHRVVENQKALEEAGQKLIQDILQSSPGAVKRAKHFILDIKEKSFEEKLITAAQALAEIRATPEAKEGFSAFLEKRKPKW